MRAVACAWVVSGLAVAPLLGAENAAEGPAASQPATRPAVTSAPSHDDHHPPPAPAKIETPDEIVRTRWPAVIAVLQNQELDRATKEKEIERIVSPVVDFPLMARLALGKTHWSRLTPPQRERYLRLFVERLRRSYREKIALYEGEEILIKFLPAEGDAADAKAPSRTTTARRTRSRKIVRIPIELTSKGKPAIILHKFRAGDKGWKLYDVEIEGVSILLTYRSQFNDLLRSGTIEELLSRLEEPPPP